MNSKNLGQRLRRFRKEAHLTQSELAQKIGITPTYLSIIERGVQLPRLETFIKLANILRVSANDLLFDHAADFKCDRDNYLFVSADSITQEQFMLIQDTVKLMSEYFKKENA